MSQKKVRCCFLLELRRERQARGWSLTKVTTLTGIDAAALSKIERCVWPCGPSWRKRIAAAFEMTEEKLFARIV